VTSGSSGLKGLFLYDDHEWRTVLASYARVDRLPRAPGQKLIAVRRLHPGAPHAR